MQEHLKKSDIFWTRFCHFCHISLQSTSTVSRNGPSNRVERRNPRFGWTKSYIIFLVVPNLLWPFSIHLHLFSSHPLMYMLTKVYKKTVSSHLSKLFFSQQTNVGDHYSNKILMWPFWDNVSARKNWKKRTKHWEKLWTWYKAITWTTRIGLTVNNLQA